MELPLTNVPKCSVRSVIQFLVAENVSVPEIHRRLVNVYGEGVISDGQVRKWKREFTKGRTNVHDEERSGRPSTSRVDDSISAVRDLLESDARLTLSDIVLKVHPKHELTRSSVYRIITEDLNCSKVCARWVPRLLSDQHKQDRTEAAHRFLEMLEDEGESLYDRIVTGDETWIHHYTPESKKQSMVWKTVDQSAPKKAKVENSAGKVMATVFWDNQGILLIDNLERGTTINADRYCEVLEKLRAAIKRKRPGKLSKKVLFFHDNARPHSANVTKELLRKFDWDIFPHPPYSPDLAPSDFFLFPSLKSHLGGRRFVNNEELDQAVITYFSQMGTQWYADGLGKLEYRYRKCIEKNGDYVEK
uniref:Mariner Mos1 transposase n=2 Tax=Lygus hesperus TaxID=30085 RepID=A0A0A9YJU3_LYGHE